jgi:Flp pilus assembly protein TadG
MRRLGALARSLFADERGQALPEFAFVLLPLLLVVLGIVEFGLALNTQSDQTHLANEVARYAIINENPGGAEELQQWAKKQGDNNFISGAGAGKICISFPEGAEAGKPVRVEATSKIKWLPLLPSTKGTSLGVTTLTSTAYMRLEASPSNYKAGCSK